MVPDTSSAETPDAMLTFPEDNFALPELKTIAPDAPEAPSPVLK
jgi:hypothetical protein